MESVTVTKCLVEMFPGFWIRRPSTFGKYLIFHYLQRFSANNFTSKNAILFIFVYATLFQGLKGHGFFDACAKFVI